MNPHSPPLHLKPVLSVNIEQEQDLVTARQRARQLSAMLGLGQQDQTRIATAVSEISRNAYQYAGGGRLDFALDLQSRPQFFWMQVSDKGPGVKNVESVLAGTYVSPTGMGIGLAGASRLMDRFDISSLPGQGTLVRFGKALSPTAKPVEMTDIGHLCSSLSQQPAAGPSEELARQNRDLLQTLETLRQRESELEKRRDDLSRLNAELEETNRGVLALYAELDEKAIALRRADEIKSRVLFHVSHEFRTPVNAMLALTRLLLQHTDGDLSSEQEKQVSYIRDAAQQLADMVNDLLDLAKADSGKTELRITTIDAGQFLGSIRALMRPLATNDAVTLAFEEPPENFLFESDESKLGQILRNLVSNALKFTLQGEVKVSTGFSAQGDALVFTVSDTGIGIAAEDQDRIFQEFTQLEHSIQRQVKGTGLGLSLSRRLANLLGATLEVESSLGSGSTFKLTLPHLTPPNLGETQPDLSLLAEEVKTILVVDDESASRYLARKSFEGTRYRIVETSGVEALKYARRETPALILLDLIMPGRNGFEVLDDLQSDEKTRNIPVIIHTSKEMTEADHARLGNRERAVLFKTGGRRHSGLLAIRQILGDPYLFSSEPEFSEGVIR